MSILKVENISAGYRDRIVIKEISLELCENDRILLIGPNGAGKSTLLKVIGGLLKPSSGKVYLKEEDITHWSVEKRVRFGLGYLLQERNIFPSLTVRENFELAGYYLPQRELEKRLEEILKYLPMLKEKLNITAGVLSGGERQALALGLVILRKPEVILLDEPTAGLAPAAAKEILRLISTITKEISRPFILVEHRLKEISEIEGLVNKVVILINGKIESLLDHKIALTDIEYLTNIFMNNK